MDLDFWEGEGLWALRGGNIGGFSTIEVWGNPQLRTYFYAILRTKHTF